MEYYRPILEDVAAEGSVALAEGWCRFRALEVLQRGKPPLQIAANEAPDWVLERLTVGRSNILGLAMNTPNVMGILNVTPDSFSDGGDHFDPSDAETAALRMVQEGATLIDIGGESTRPGAKEVPVDQEVERVLGALCGLRAHSAVPVSIDTRKAGVAHAVAGTSQAMPWMLNDVSALRFDPDLAAVAAQTDVPVCLMHSIGTPETMQTQARYDDVLLDVYDHLEERIAFAVAAGIARDRIIVDPGIGFGKTLDHNLSLLRGISLFHTLGCPVLLGASRKRFIGTLGNAPEAKDRLGGSVSVALHGVRQGVQILRVHDTQATKQAIDLQMAITGTSGHDT